MKVTKISAALVRSLILPRKKNSHKGDYGHVLVIAGSKNMTGAAVLCAHGALRSGAGLVTLGTAKSILPLITKKLRPEAMTLPLEEAAGKIISKAADKALDFAKKRKISVMALGPGLGKGREITGFIKKIIHSARIPVILDADGLNALKSGDFKKAGADVVVTPHPGEMSRLSGLKAFEIQKARERTAKEFAAETGTTCVLKGSGTVVSDGRKVYVNTTGNPGMAKGGSGDVLTGVIAALISQVREPRPLNAAICGVFLHGLAGDIAAREKTRMGMLPGDISESMPEASRRTLKSS